MTKIEAVVALARRIADFLRAVLRRQLDRASAASVDVPMVLFTVGVAALILGVSPGVERPVSPRTTGQLEARLETQPGDAVPTTVWLGGIKRPKWQRVRVVAKAENWQCARIEPSGAVVVDLLCCEWRRDPAANGRFVLVQRSSFPHSPPGARRSALVQECRERNGAKPLPTTLESLAIDVKVPAATAAPPGSP